MVKVFENINELTKSVAVEISSLLESINKIYIALSGGSTPQAIFQSLAQNYRDIIDWNKIHFFWVDERCVGQDHPDSNYGMAKKALLDHIKISFENIHPINCNKNYQEEIQKYSDEIKSIVPIENNLPRFDIILLGVGSDGHTASIFHDQICLMKSDEICALSHHPETNQARATLTGRVINNAKKVIFIATGKNKSVVVSNILSNNFEIRLPAGYIKPIDGTLDWFLDRDASSLL